MKLFPFANGLKKLLQFSSFQVDDNFISNMSYQYYFLEV